jgi:uncharacterized protein
VIFLSLSAFRLEAGEPMASGLVPTPGKARKLLQSEPVSGFPQIFGGGSIPMRRTMLLFLIGAASAALAANPNFTIPQIQGSGDTSPKVGQAVSTSGIVTALEVKGFFLQDPVGDGDSATSDGIFVFTNSAPTVHVGDNVAVSGTVEEYQGATQIKLPTVTVLSSGNALPAAKELTASFPSPTGSLTQLEALEGMRVHIASARTSGPTNQYGEVAIVIPPNDRTYREKGILTPGLPGLPVFDGNPQRMFLDTDALSGTTPKDLTSDVSLSDITAVVDYNFAAYKLNPSSFTVGSANLVARPVRTRASREFLVGSFNMLHMYDTIDDPNIPEPVIPPDQYAKRLTKMALAIVQEMQAPDILGVEEVENIGVVRDIAARVQQLDPSVSYTAYLVEGNDLVAGIDVGLLVRDNVQVISVTQEGKDTTYVNPATNQPELLNDRPPLVLRASACVSGSKPFPLTVIVNHLRSLNGIDDPTDGPRVRAKRKAQAEFLADLVQEIQVTSPAEKVAVVGDFNAFQLTDGYVDVAGIIKGAPDQDLVGSTDLVEPDLTDLVETLPPDEQYSFSFGGDSQVLDHIFVTQNLESQVTEMAYARNNADFPSHLLELDDTRPERASDHDMPVAFVQTLAASPTDTTRCR